MQRRLAAILAADVEGYSRLIGEDEEGTVRALKENRAAFFRIVAEGGGTVINTAGDSILAEFGSVMAAVRAATAMQEALRHANAGQAAARQLRFRIGISQGEIVAEGGEIYGDGINVAARLQALAPAGGIAISGRVHEDVAGKLDLVWLDGGDQHLKNIRQPVRVFFWPSPGSADSAAPPLPDRPSIAVLRFHNMSREADDVFFCDGMAEDIITGLARFRSLFVIARNSSFAFHGQSVALPEIGRRLGVSYLLEGSVRRSGDRLRITAQLIEAAGGAHVWADRFDRSLTEAFEVQDEVATRIVATLVGRIEAARLEQAVRRPTASLAAYDLLQKRKATFRGYEADANSRVRDLFRQAAERDPRFAQAHSYLALTELAVEGYGRASTQAKTSACETARRGVELDPQDGTCHRILGHLSLYTRSFAIGERHARQSVELNPNDADCAISLGFLLSMRGQHAEGLEWIDRAVRLNPLHPPWYHVQRGTVLYHLGNTGEALREFRMAPRMGGWSYRLAACCARLGLAEEAAAEARTVLAALLDFSARTFVDQMVLLERAEDRDLLLQDMLKAGLPG
ncbi:adenylate/guanylate cyclase domain-containing protein [Aquibium sp. LZ166]|uniref:Adenylate/guanylate cyclase domain-containing protein n=1 Tax=Aquibium pacificus TaxID=3153579 RepID=A0ABV3SDM7_9HYPH